MIIEISIAVIALAFVALVIYLIVLICALRTTLGQVNNTLSETRKQLNDVGFQAQKAAEHANQISYDLKYKAEALNPVFNAISNAGQILEHKSSVIKKEYIAAQEEAEGESLRSDKKGKALHSEGIAIVAAVLELAGLGVSLWQKMNKRR